MKIETISLIEETLKPGAMFVMVLPGTMDYNMIPEDLNDEEYKKRLKQEFEKASRFPAVIVKENKYGIYENNTFDVVIRTRWRTGPISGEILIPEMCVWRFIDTKSQVPESFLKYLRECYIDHNIDDSIKNFWGLSYEELFYVDLKENKIVYPFKSMEDK